MDSRERRGKREEWGRREKKSYIIEYRKKENSRSVELILCIVVDVFIKTALHSAGVNIFSCSQYSLSALNLPSFSTAVTSATPTQEMNR